MPHDLPDEQRILDILQNFHGIEPLKQLFWGELNYDRQNDPISRESWTPRDISSTADDPLLFATAGNNSDFQLIYTRLDSDRLLLTAERPIISRLLKDYPRALFIFSNREQTDWHFVNVKHITQKHRLLRRITIGPYRETPHRLRADCDAGCRILRLAA